MGFLTSDRHRGHDRHAGFDGGSDVSGAAVEVDDVLRQRRAECVIVAAGKVQHDRTAVQRLRRVFPAGMDNAEAAQVSVERCNEHAVVGNGVQRAGAQRERCIGATMVDANILSPGYSFPYGQIPEDPGFALVADKAFVDRAHALGLKVIPWTINDADTMRSAHASPSRPRHSRGPVNSRKLCHRLLKGQNAESGLGRYVGRRGCRFVAG